LPVKVANNLDDSVKVVVNDAGKAITRYEYKPYGESWFTEGDEEFAPKYNSQELDKETNFYFYNARYYDPEICRFVTADNVVPYENDSQSWNRFSYVRNNPIIYSDPTGHYDFGGLDTKQNSVGDQLLNSLSTPGKNDSYNSKVGGDVKDKLAKAKGKNDNLTSASKNDITCEKLATINGNRIPISQSDYDNNSKIKMTSKFGNRTDPTDGGKTEFHPGIDIKAPEGTKVHATKDGKVWVAGIGPSGIDKDYGRRIYINHDKNEQTLDGHLSKVYVKPGQEVKSGQLIGEVGNTGRSTGPHLHHELRKDGKPIDPIPKKE
jgi:RHS repeat-associated protein